jgi:hypothetical protein
MSTNEEQMLNLAVVRFWQELVKYRDTTLVGEKYKSGLIKQT